MMKVLNYLSLAILLACVWCREEESEGAQEDAGVIIQSSRTAGITRHIGTFEALTTRFIAAKFGKIMMVTLIKITCGGDDFVFLLRFMSVTEDHDMQAQMKPR